jgi:TonB family protein
MNARDDLSFPPATEPSASLAARLVHYAARHVPADLSERLEEEWLADLAAQMGRLARLRFALGCCWARQVIAHDALAFGARASAASVGHGTLPGVDIPHLSPLPRRAAVFMLILGLHAAAILGFIYGVRTITHTDPPPPIHGTIYDVPRKPQPLPPGPRPDFTHPTRIPTVIPLGWVPPISYPSYEPTSDPVPAPTGSTHMLARKLGGPGKGFPATQDFYPASAIRMGESGLAAVQVCIDDQGRLTSDPRIARSSGSSRLDTGALALAKAGSGHYRSTTEDGRPVSSCFPFAVRFTLNN